MRTASKFLILSLALSSAGLGCGRVGGLAGALPGDDAVSINVPGSQRAQSSSTAQGLLGDTSEFYVHTYRISRFLNAHVVGLLAHLRAITNNRPTSTEGDVSTWGPHTPGGLEPLTYRLTATKVAEHKYTLNLEARPKASNAEEDFVTLLDGEVEGSGQEDGRGKGVLSLHFDNARAINPTVRERGNIHVSFDATTEPRSVAVDFEQFAGAEEDAVPASATYRYNEAQDASGSFLFSVLANVHKASEAKPGLEKMTLKSRWVASGEGRGDVTVEGDEVAAQLLEAGLTAQSVQATECWGADFNVVFQDTLPAELAEHIRPTQGDAAACAVAQAEFPASQL